MTSVFLHFPLAGFSALPAPSLFTPHLVFVPASTPESQTLCVLPPKPSAASEIIGQVLTLAALASPEQPHRLAVVLRPTNGSPSSIAEMQMSQRQEVAALQFPGGTSD